MTWLLFLNFVSYFALIVFRCYGQNVTNETVSTTTISLQTTNGNLSTTVSLCNFTSILIGKECVPCNCSFNNATGSCYLDSETENVTCICNEGYVGEDCSDLNEAPPYDDFADRAGILIGVIVLIIVIVSTVCAVIVCRRQSRLRGKNENIWSTTATRDDAPFADLMEPTATTKFEGRLLLDFVNLTSSYHTERKPSAGDPRV